MGCNDYYDPSYEREEERWRKNNALIIKSNCQRTCGSGEDFAVCYDCGAMVWTGDLRREDDLPFVRIHHLSHEKVLEKK